MKTNILFIGNSYTYYNEMPDILEKLAKENGKDVRVFSVTCGGHKLWEYAHGDDEYTAKIDELIRNYRFDICFLQEQSLLPITDNDLFIRGVSDLIEKLKPVTETFILYETWARKKGCPMLEELGITYTEMTYNLSKAYCDISERTDALVSHVGLNFYDVCSKDLTIELYNEDMSHPSFAGSCLAALTHYCTIFGCYPENTNFLSLTETENEVFKNTVIKNMTERLIFE